MNQMPLIQNNISPHLRDPWFASVMLSFKSPLNIDKRLKSVVVFFKFGSDVSFRDYK